jgi:molybdate transport system ATP-binding protein
MMTLSEHDFQDFRMNRIMLLKKKMLAKNHPVNLANPENRVQKMTQPILAQFQLNYSAFQLDVDLQLPSSGITVLFGHSGSGKTTLLRCIAGLQHAPQGFLQINGEVWQDSNQKIFLPTYKRNLGYVFQEANLFPHLTVFGNLCYGLKRIQQSSETEHFKQVIELLGIEHLMARMPERLSGGERQRVGIARALVLNPEILLMDEPLASLDAKRKQEILPFLTRLHNELNVPVLYVTHSQQEVAQLADYLVLLADGKVQAAGSLAETFSRLDLPQAQDRQAASVWQVNVVEHEVDYHLTRVAFAGGELSLPSIDAALGTPLRVQIYARDVSITLEVAKATSILNVLPAIINDMVDDESGQSMVRLQVGSQPLLAHITRKSAQLLNLQTGMSVYVQVKGTSILN